MLAFIIKRIINRAPKDYYLGTYSPNLTSAA